MTEIIKKTLRDSSAARWTALIIVSFTMMWGYFLTDAMSPLMTMLQKEMGWTSTDFGIFNWSYMWFNVFCFMLIFGGIILDKLGVRITGLASCAFMVVGAATKYYAVEYITPGVGSMFGLHTQVLVACIGYALFAVGTENCGITVSKVIVKWFEGKEMALAMGVQVAVARLGTMFAMIISPVLAKHYSMSTPLFMALIMLVIGLLAYVMYCVMDRRLDNQLAEEKSGESQDEDVFKISDLKYIVTNKGFWLLALLCLTFYSAVFPFMKYAASLMENKYGVDPEWAGIIPSLLPLGNLIMTPLFGSIYDRVGKGATLMIIGSALLIVVHVLFALPIFEHWIFAMVIVIMLGVAFSLVPSAMWPSVPKVIPQKLIGSAYSLIFWIQNIGLGGVPLLIGWVLDHYCKTEVVGGIQKYDYTLPMCIFVMFGVLAIVLAFMLKKEDARKGYGLESGNIKD